MSPRSLILRITGLGAAAAWWRRAVARRRFRSQLAAFREQARASDRSLEVSDDDLWPCLGEDVDTHPLDHHYVYHLGWAARVLARTRPQRHVDLSSYVYFNTVASAFVPIEHYDLRRVDLRLDGLRTGAADLTALPFEDASIASLSCMHAVEHVGLGRYGDRLEADGDLKAMHELARVLAPSGQLLFVVPVGRPRVCFNAHRVYAMSDVVDAFEGLELAEFALLPDDVSHGLVADADAELVASQEHGCGCFLFHKPEGR